MRVKLVATVKLLVSPEERDRLLATMRRVNEACSWLAERAFEARSADKIALQRAHYRELRDRFGLSAQHAVRAISTPFKRPATCTLTPWTSREPIAFSITCFKTLR